MSVLDRPISDIEKPEKITANGRYFYNPEEPDESLHSRIINYTNKLFDHYKLNGGLDFMFVQLLRSEGEFVLIEMGVSGDNISLKYDGTALAGTPTPLWEIVISHQGGRSVNQLILHGGLHVIQRDYDHQGKLRGVSTPADILSTWNAVETILEDELTHDYLVSDIPDQYLRSFDTVEAKEASQHKKIEFVEDQNFRQSFNCQHTPEEARNILNDLFCGEEGPRLQQVYRDGMYHINNLRKYDTAEARFFVMVQTLSEIAARLQDRPTDATILG